MKQYPKCNLRYGNKDDGMAELYVDICELEDDDLYISFRFYCYLINYYMENTRHRDYPIYADDIWPYVNRYKAAFSSYIKCHEENELKKVTDFVLNKFKNENDIYLKKVNEKFFKLLDKVSKPESIRIDYEQRREWSKLEPEFGIELNEIYSTLELIRMRTYYNALMESILRKEKIEKRNFVTSIILTVIGTALAIIGIILTIFFGISTL